VAPSCCHSRLRRDAARCRHSDNECGRTRSGRDSGCLRTRKWRPRGASAAGCPRHGRASRGRRLPCWPWGPDRTQDGCRPHGSLGRGRLWEQIGRIRDEALSPFLLVEGEALDAGPRHPNAIRGALLAIAELGVTILWSRDPADSALWLHRLGMRDARKARARTRPRRTPDVIDPGIGVLAAVPGISIRTARSLLSRFGSIDGLLGAGPERWAEVDGVGAVRAHALATALLEAPGRIPAGN
jgi:hypothetical protein